MPSSVDITKDESDDDAVVDWIEEVGVGARSGGVEERARV